MDIFQRLYGHYGPRGWWPAETPFEVILGAILTQNVAWKNVQKAVSSLRAAGLLEIEALHRAPVEQVERLIRPTGYYRQKTIKIRAFLDHLFTWHGGSLDRLFAVPLPELRRELLSIHGIGPETADAILCYAGGFPIMVMDAYTRRVFSRLGLTHAKAGYDELQSLFMDHLRKESRLFNEYHALIDMLARHICTKSRPACGRCPLISVCREGAAGAGREEREREAGAGSNSNILTDNDLQTLADRINTRWYGFSYRTVRFKRQILRWGSCSLRTRNLYVSDRLKGGPEELIEYLLVHELCHLGVPNHSPAFWELVSRACPDYREKRRRLRLWDRR